MTRERVYDIYLALTHPDVSCKEAKSAAGQARLVEAFERELSKGGMFIDDINGEHVDRADCWCQPVRDYQDPVSGAEVWVHRDVVS